MSDEQVEEFQERLDKTDKKRTRAQCEFFRAEIPKVLNYLDDLEKRVLAEVENIKRGKISSPTGASRK